MTGLEVLKDKMRALGASENMVNSKSVKIAIQAMTDMDDYEELINLEDDIIKAENELTNLEVKVEELRFIKQTESKWLEEEEAKRQAEMDAKSLEFKKYMEEIEECFKNTETPEGRDCLRKAQMFVNTVEINSKYDNTAFIISLGAILSEGRINAPAELKKINKNLFEREYRGYSVRKSNPAKKEGFSWDTYVPDV